jgi:homopolymeric O-antigen transport system permease protein
MSDLNETSPGEPLQVTESTRFQFQAAFDDIVAGALSWRIWLQLSWQEFMSTYRRSAFGAFWVILSFGIFVFIKIVVFGALLGATTPPLYDSHLVLGFFVWFFISQNIIAAPDVFVAAKGWIRSEPLPYSLYVFKAIMREFYNLALSSTVVVAVLAYLGTPIRPGAFWLVPGLLFLMINAFAIKLLLGTISARLRDLSHFFRAIMQSMMFLTPIFWMPEQMGGLMKVLWWNPLLHYLEIIRAPILHGTLPLESWLFCLTLFATIGGVGFILFARFRQRIVYWF